MSYLARLVDRAVGAPGGTASPRLGPIFPLGPAPVAADEPERGPGVLPSSLPESPPPRAPVPLPSDAAAAAAPAATAVAAAPVPPRQERRPVGEPPGRDREPAAAPGHAAPIVATPSPVVAGTEPAIRTAERGASPQRGTAEHPAPAPSAIEVSAVAPAERPTATAFARPDTTRDSLPVRGDRDSRGAPEHAPQIEVRIGRVEVRRPPEPEPAQWPTTVPQPAPATDGFDRLAAARRYVDRRWS